MLYEEINECINICGEHILEGGGKITNIILRDFNFPDNIKILIKDDYNIFYKIIKFYYDDFNNKISYYDDYDSILNNLEFIVNKTSEIKEKYIIFNEEILPWLKSTDFFLDIFNNNNIINPNEITSIKYINIDLRANQIEAFNNLNNDGLITGIHCQATGCGKSYIIIKYIDYINTIMKNPKIILFTERVNILSDFFSFKKGDLSPDNKKLEHWKNNDIGDLTNFNIINRVTVKKHDWVELLKNATKSTLLVINRAYLTLGNLYNKLNNNDLHLVLHDECHNTTSEQCHKLLLKCKSLNIPIIGFSATPLRTGKNDKKKILEIYNKNIDELNLLTDYNMIYAINKELILPPEFYWYQIESYDKKKDNKITQEDLGSVLELLNYIIPNLPNKKIIAWCGTINRANTWKELFETSHKQRKNLKNFKFGIDTSESISNDYDDFSKQSNNNEMYNGCSILFCANKHREGSDIPLLDCCIFLDEVKNRGAIPFIQSIGRVLRICTDTPNKTKGVVIDGIIKENNNYDREFVDKIIGYYMALENLTSNDKTKYEQYIELRDIVKFDKEKETINMKLGSSIIKIHCNKLDWNNIINKFDNLLLHKIQLSAEEHFRSKLDIFKNIFNFNINTNFTKEYEKISDEDKLKYNLPNIYEEEYSKLFKNYTWFELLNIEYDFYSENELINELKKYNFNEWKSLYKNNKKIPKYPKYIYKNFSYNLIHKNIESINLF